MCQVAFTVSAREKCSVYIENNILCTLDFIKICQPLGVEFVIITDSNVGTLYGQDLYQYLLDNNLRVKLLSFPAGERYKTRETKADLEDQLIQLGCGRDACLIALGGGVVLDIVGFVAATFYRGVNVIYCPTSMLAMVDASVGGKTGVNTPQGKNLLGVIRAPQVVVMDLAVLVTEDQRSRQTGLVETVKHALLTDRDFFEFLNNNIDKIKQGNNKISYQIIKKSCLIKKNIIEQDEFERNKRVLLNLGHTVGHALEAASGFLLSHGEAVAWGIVIESAMSKEKGILPEKELNDIINIFKKLSVLSQNAKQYFCVDILKKYINMDKKNIDHQPQWIALERIGKPYYQIERYSENVDFFLLASVLNGIGDII